MDFLHIEDVTELRRPLMLTAFAGWNDAAQGATGAIRFLIEQWQPHEFARIDPEEYFDFSSLRPMIEIGSDFVRNVVWPTNALYWHADANLHRDVILMLGIEPHLKWRSFTSGLLDLAQSIGVTTIVSLGAFVGYTTHTRPVSLTGYSADPALTERLNGINATASRYEGPTGIPGVLQAAGQRRGIQVGSLWGAAPHYLGPTPNPGVALALLEGVDKVFELNLNLTDLRNVAENFAKQVNDAVSGNEEIVNHIHELERRIDANEEVSEAEGEPQASDSLIKELEDFLRRQRGGSES